MVSWEVTEPNENGYVITGIFHLGMQEARGTDHAYLTQGKHIILDLHRTYSLSHKSFLLHPHSFQRGGGEAFYPENAIICVHCILYLYYPMNSTLDIVLTFKNLNIVMFSYNLKVSEESSNQVRVKII